MKRKLILFKTLLRYIFMSKQNLLLAFICLGSINLAYAEVVQRWQDNSGQWHFGDQAAALGKKTQTVFIKNPISVIGSNPNTSLPKTGFAKTDLTKRSSKAKKVSSKSRTQPRSKVSDANALYKQQCDALREKVHLQPVSGKAISLRQNLVQQYERGCIAGNYYAN